MNKLHLYNIEAYQRYKLCEQENPNQLSSPLLASPQIIESPGKILYIGQETNTWGKEINNNFISNLEALYDNFLKNDATNRPYWKFIKGMINESLYDSVVWSNLLLCGKKDTLGTPNVSQQLLELSEDYLYHLYEVSKPRSVVIASSPNSVYKELINHFFEKVDCDIKDTLSTSQPVLVDEEKNIIWTYHPRYLAQSKNTEKVKTICKKYINK